MEFKFSKIAYIRKLPSGKWRVYSEKGKNLGTFDTKEDAEKRLKQVHFFKYKKANSNILDLSSLDELSYSAVMRELRKQCSNDIIQLFLSYFKEIFDSLLLNGKSAEVAAEQSLPASLFLLNYKIEVKFND